MRNGKEVIRETDKKEIRRYLGYHGKEADETVEREIDACFSDLCLQADPRAVFRRCGLVHHGDGTLTVEALPEDRDRGILMEIRSRSLSKNLRGCSGVYLMAATLGPGPDLLVRRAQILHAGKMVIYQAAGAAMVERWCDEVNREIREEAARRGLYCRPRFSPGYGDLPMDLQTDFEKALLMKKEIGVALTESLLMIPTKSVTALIGLSREKTACDINGCEFCTAAESCDYRRT